MEKEDLFFSHISGSNILDLFKYDDRICHCIFILGKVKEQKEITTTITIAK